MFDIPFNNLLAVFILVYIAHAFLSSRKKKARKQDHNFFQELFLWPKGSPACWQASIELAGETIHIYSEEEPQQDYREPTAAEIVFCRNTLSNLPQLYARALPAIHEAWTECGLAKALLENWEEELRLDCFSVPVSGNVNSYWGVSYYSKTAERYFSVGFHRGKPVLESVVAED